MKCRIKGFTLTELLAVVAIIAAISGIAIVTYGSVDDEAAESANLATMRSLTNAITNYQNVHKGKLPNGLDTLIRTDALAESITPAVEGNDGPDGIPDTDDDVAGTPEVIDVARALYCGKDEDSDGETDSDADSLGLHSANFDLDYFGSLTVTRLTEGDIEDLKEVGLTKFWDFDASKDLFHGGYSKIQSKSTALRTDANGDAGLEVDDLVVMINPKTGRMGQQIYKSLGIDLSDMDPEGEIRGNLSDEQVATAVTRGKFFVFGIGKNCEWVGDTQTGLQEPPQCPIVGDGVYNRYFLVVEMPTGPNSMTKPTARMILDSTGKNVIGAESWGTRTK